MFYHFLFSMYLYLYMPVISYRIYIIYIYRISQAHSLRCHRVKTNHSVSTMQYGNMKLVPITHSRHQKRKSLLILKK